MKSHIFQFSLTILIAIYCQPIRGQQICGENNGLTINECYAGFSEKDIIKGCALGTGKMISDPISPIPLCNDMMTVYNNPSYFVFEANGLDYFSIEVTPIQGTCNTLGTNTGVQSILLNSIDCTGLNPISDCIGECQVEPFILTTYHIPEADEIIVLVVDGCAGSICDLSFNVISGMEYEAIPPSSEEISAMTINNEGELQCGNLFLRVEPAIDELCNYIWYFPNGESEITNTVEITVNVNEFPNGEICVQGFNEDCFPGVFFPEDKTICYNLLKDTILAMVYADPTSCGRDNGFAFVDNVFDLQWEYIWSNGITSEVNPDLAAGMYTITITNSKGCEVIDSVFIAPSDRISAEIEIVQPDCGENNGSIKINASGGFNNNLNFSWSNNPWLNSDSLTYLSPGFYNVTIIDENDWSCSIVISNIEIFDELDVIIDEVSHSDKFIPNGSITFSVEDNIDFRYILTTPSNIIEGTGSNIDGLGPGKYSLEVISLEDEDCKFTYEFVIKGLNKAISFITFRDDIHIFPNPVNDILYIERVDSDCTYEIFSVAGELIQRAVLVENFIDLNNFAQGVYFVRIYLLNGELSTKKVVKM